MKVPFIDLSRQNGVVLEGAVRAMEEAAANSSFVGGARVADFERHFAGYCHTPYGVAVNSGTDALRLAMLACGVSPGDEVVTVPFTFIATAEAISQCGAIPVFADVDPLRCCMDASSLEKAVTPRTRGVVPVHLYGHPAPMDDILKVARARGLWVVEDACQAHGARLEGRGVGSMGDAGAFSFYPTKNLGAWGEGGFITTSSEDVARKAEALRNHGQSSRYSHDFEGYNARLDSIQAAILDLKLEHLPRWTSERVRIAGDYLRELSGVGDLALPEPAPGADHVYCLFTVRTSRRDDLRRHLGECGIGAAVHYPVPLHMQKAYSHLGYGEGRFPVSEACSRSVLSLPLFTGITGDEVGAVVQAVKRFFSR